MKQFTWKFCKRCRLLYHVLCGQNDCPKCGYKFAPVGAQFPPKEAQREEAN